MAMKFSNLFYFKALQNFGLVWKYTIWQPWSRNAFFSLMTCFDAKNDVFELRPAISVFYRSRNCTFRSCFLSCR
jgi:hypothetical protein